MISSRGCGLLGVGGLHGYTRFTSAFFLFLCLSSLLLLLLLLFASPSPRLASLPPLLFSTTTTFLLSSSSFSSFVPSRGYIPLLLLLASRRWYSRERTSGLCSVCVYVCTRRHEDRGSQTTSSTRARASPVGVACARSTWCAVDVRVTSVAMPCSERVERKEQRKRSNV